MAVVKVSLMRSFALLYEVVMKVTHILHMDLVKELPLLTFTEKKYKIQF